jgi:hypothetical protein
MSRSLRITFLVHAIVALLMGVPLLAAPGRWLSLFGWAPIDPLMSRMLGAALLAMAWSSVRGYLAEEWDQVEIVVELEVAFTVLASFGLLRHLLIGTWPWYTWAIFGIFALFSVAWIYHLVKKK